MDRVDQLVDQGQIPHPDNAINTAIVLPDESLFVPLMNSVSQKIKHFNVTMGYPLRHSNIVSLMHLVARAHKQATRSADNWVYYREYVKDIMSHPIIKSIFTREVMQVTQAIEERNEWNIPSDLLCRNGFSTLFTPLRDTSNKQEIIDYIDRLIAFCNKVSDSIKEKEPVVPKNVTDEHDDDANIKKLLPLQSAFIELYVNHRDILKFNQLFNIYVQAERIDQEDLQPYEHMINGLADLFHEMYVKAQSDHSVRTDIPEREMFSTTIHLMLAAVTRYAVGLVYRPVEGFDDLGELRRLKHMMLEEFRQK